MVTTSKTWTSTLNVSLAAGSQVTQYQTFMLEWANQYLAAGWTHVRSSNSLTTSATNLWLTTADIVHGLSSSSQARSWIILQSPASWGAPTGGGRYYVAIDCQVLASSTTPQTCHFYFSTDVISEAVSTPTITALTHNANRTHLETSNMNVFAWTTGATAAGYMSFWRTSSGDVFFFTKLATSASYTSAQVVLDPTNARGNWRATAGFTRNQTPAINILFDSSYWFGFLETGASSIPNNGVAVSQVSAALTMNAWSGASGGQDSAGDVMYSQMIGAVNVGTVLNRRFYGVIPDVWVTRNTTFSFDDTSDTDPVVLRGFNGLALPVPTGTGALL